jgi:hypothetical protein
LMAKGILQPRTMYTQQLPQAVFASGAKLCVPVSMQPTIANTHERSSTLALELKLIALAIMQPGQGKTQSPRSCWATGR